MKVLIQRVTHAQVEVASRVVGQIEKGLLLFVGIQPQDTPQILRRMAEKVLGYRVFADEQGKMNLNVQQVNGGVLAVSQFTLAAETQKGLRPSFSCAASPEQAQKQFEEFAELLKRLHSPVETGIFAADMQVSLNNDGPVTFLLEMQ